MRTIFAAACVFLMASAAGASPIRLAPAEPQPDPATLKDGLHVEYVFPGEVTSLDHAASWLEYGTKPGEPLVGFDYPDTLEGEPTLTSGQAMRVVASIKGYIYFDKPGIHQLEFISNDGLSVVIGGQEVSRYDGRHPCDSAGFQDVEAPIAGWYPLEALYFQRLGTSCLLMKSGAPGTELDWTPNEAFKH